MNWFLLLETWNQCTPMFIAYSKDRFWVKDGGFVYIYKDEWFNNKIK